MADGLGSLKLVVHPVVRKRHTYERARFSHFDGRDEELLELVKEAFQSGQARPGKFPGTFIVQPPQVARFYAPGEGHVSGPVKPQANHVSVVVWTAPALLADGDKLATKCTHAIVSIRAAV